MLTLREVELHGFKSFADRTRLLLPGQILSVVGPNGAGKSNIVDAVLWALGEQSAKQLRSQKMQEVIFNGSHKRSPSGTAEVTLVFHEEETGHPIRMGRRLMRSGDSAYLIDGRSVRLKDIHNALMLHGVSIQGTFLVEQGQVADLLQASPEDRRKVIEEAAGIAHYKENRRSAMQKLESAQANLLRLSDILSEVGTQLRSLKRQASKADRYVKLTEELVEKRKEFWGRSFSILSARRDALLRDLELQREEHQRRETLLHQVDSEGEALKQKAAEHESSLEKLQQAIHGLELEKEREEQENKRRSEQVISGKGRLRQIETDRKELELRLRGAEADGDRRAEEKATLQEEERDALSDVERCRGRLESLGEELTKVEKDREALHQDSFELAQQFTGLTTTLGRLNDDLRRQEERLDRLHREEEGLSAREEAARESLEEVRAASEVARDKWETAKARVSGEREALEAAEAEADRTAVDHAAGDRALATEQSRLAVLHEQGTKLQSSAHAFLEEHAPERAQATVAQLLSDLPSAYLAPVTSAYAPLLEAYTEGGWEGLADLLAALGRKRAGSATFLVMEDTAASHPPAVPGAKGFSGWLADAAGIPQPLAAHLPAVALTETPEDARAFARAHGVPAVSRNGVLVDPGGWVRGGAGGEGGGALLEHEREVTRCTEAVDRATKEVARLAETLERARKKREKAAVLLEEAGGAEAAAREEHQRQLVALERSETEHHRMISSQELLGSEIRQAEEERDAWLEQRASLQKDIKSLEAKRGENAARVEACEQARDGLRQKREEAHEAVAKAGASHSETVERLKATEEAHAAALQRIEEIKGTLERFRSEKTTIDGRLASLTEEIGRGDRTLRDLLLRLEKEREHKARYDEEQKRLQEECAAAERKVREAREALQEVREDLNRQEVAQAGLDAELRNLRERIGEVFPDPPESIAAAFMDAPPLSDEERETMHQALQRMEARIESIGAVNMLAREEYRELDERHGFLLGQKSDLEESIASLEETIRKINRTTRDRFMEAFRSIQEHFSHLFREVFEGGEARLSLLDESNPLETGMEIYVQPPDKKLQSLRLLSGGEKAMVALALLFALFRHKPQPFFILDEVDAPLDDANIERFSRLLDQFAGQTQFLIVTHNKRTMELADVLYGVTMVESGVSRVVSVRLEEVESKILPGEAE